MPGNVAVEMKLSRAARDFAFVALYVLSVGVRATAVSACVRRKSRYEEHLLQYMPLFKCGITFSTYPCGLGGRTVGGCFRDSVRLMKMILKHFHIFGHCRTLELIVLIVLFERLLMVSARKT